MPETPTTPTTPTDKVVTPAAPEAQEKSLLDGGDVKPQAPEGQKEESVLDQAGKEAKAAAEAETKRLLETPDDQLSEEDKSKKAAAVKAKEDADKAAQEKAKLDAVPKKYEFKPPEGFTLDQALVEQVTPLFKELKLSQGNAQKLVEFYAGQLKAISDAQAASFNKFVEDSKAETIKALGANYKEELAYAAKVKERFLSTETVEALNASGLANNKNLILDLIKIGKLVSETKLVEGPSAPAAGEQSPAKKLYPDQGKK